MTVRFVYAPSRRPPAPVIPVTVSSPDGARSLGGIEALLDTGADQTILPLSLAAQLNPPVVGQVAARGFGGQPYLLDVYRVLVEVPGVVSTLLDVPAHSGESYILLGRDVLNQFRVTFDGPNQVVEFH